MEHDLVSISPINGRYRREVQELSDYFSEFALMRERVFVEIEYLIFLSKLLNLDLKAIKKKTIKIRKEFDFNDAKRIKELEEKIKHDVKAIEIFLKEKIDDKKVSPYIHFGLTSEDINNLAYARLLKRFTKKLLLPVISVLILELCSLAKKSSQCVMLSRTHGQPASPTTFGKEIAVFAQRLMDRFEKLKKVRFAGKLNGAVGNYNAFVAAFPEIDWIKETKQFVRKMGLEPIVATTQIVPHESYSDFFYLISSINNIVLSLNQDLWLYLSYGYLELQTEEEEVGSSTMPHKRNPKDLENSEGNLEIANSLLKLLIFRLQRNRMQRDLSDSTIKRNYGVALAHSILGYKRTISAIKRIRINSEKMLQDLLNHPEVFSEALQVLLRKEGSENAYFQVMKFVKNKN
ncbi:adenylosuccinate lyase [Candidatus Marsarchaeota G1 archaeon OSP_B]|uniref:Adenylosuccinate lyase n=1 Tax=Candidatus Marsarchaeota G1 archaeon OSP_B TaxID=1978153 RepID=A0A2R6B8D8_9ARCH|nr:MAG: adenylosuccinate lyase [Candidatus Marsarchaeota G1 archaeon OSP_B]